MDPRHQRLVHGIQGDTRNRANQGSTRPKAGPLCHPSLSCAIFFDISRMVLRWLFLTCSIVWVPEVFGQAVPAMANTPATGAEAFWVSGPIFADAPKLSAGIRDILSADLNSDGRLDKVYATRKGLLVQWGEDTPELWGEPEALTLPDATGSPLQLLANGSSQLGEIQKSPFAMHGEVGWSEVPQFWVRWSAPERMLGYRFDGERLSTVTQVSLSPGLLVDVTRGGVVFGPSVDGKIYLEEFGVRRVLTARVPPLEHLQWTDVDGDESVICCSKKERAGLGWFGWKMDKCSPSNGFRRRQH